MALVANLVVAEICLATKDISSKTKDVESYIYTKEKLKIKCERIFEINPGNKVVGFTSKNCF